MADDAYISLRYVANLLAGHGLVFNPGEYVEGYSNPLWVLLTALLSWLTDATPVTAAKLLGLAMGGLCVYSLWRLARQLAQPRLSLALTLALLAVVPGIQIYMSNGMEVPLMCCLVLLGLQASLASSPANPRLALGAALAFGLLAITRPEGILYAALWGLTLLWQWRRQLDARRWCWLIGLGSLTLLPFMLWLGFRLGYYGSWLPNTAVAKISGMWGYGPFIYDWRGYLMPMLMCGLLLWHTARKPETQWQRLAFFTLPVVISGITFSAYAGTDWMAYGRFTLPVWPPVQLLLASWVCASLSAQPLRQSLVNVSLLLLVALNAAAGAAAAWPYLSNNGMPAMLMRGTDQVAVGRWLHESFPTPLHVGVGRLGGVSYMAPQHVFWDFLGLTDRPQAQRLRQLWPAPEPAVISTQNDIIMQRRPELLLIHRPPSPVGETYYEASEMQALQPGYTCLRRFPQGHYGVMDVWARADVAATRTERCDSVPVISIEQIGR